MTKSSPLTIGALAILVGSVVTIGGLVWSAQSKMDETCERVVKVHRDADVDRSHPDLPTRYVPRTELNTELHQLDKKLDKRLSRMEGVQQTILETVQRRNGRRRPTR